MSAKGHKLIHRKSFLQVDPNTKEALQQYQPHGVDLTVTNES